MTARRNNGNKVIPTIVISLIVILIILLAAASYFFLVYEDEEEAAQSRPIVPSRVAPLPSSRDLPAPPRPPQSIPSMPSMSGAPNGSAYSPAAPVTQILPAASENPVTLAAPESPPVPETPATVDIPDAPPPVVPDPLAAPAPPSILHPAEPLPPEDAPPAAPGISNATFRAALADVMGRGVSLMLSDELIYHLVVTIDNLPRKYLPASVVPLKRAANAFMVEGKDDTLAIAARNAERYAAHMAVAKTLDSAGLVEIYRAHYPLFQRAYREIGYPKANFNDRLIAAIDDLLAAPDPAAPIRLAQPKVLYEYADPSLEGRSAGQKIMMRVGRENAAVIKARLREIRGLIAQGG